MGRSLSRLPNLRLWLFYRTAFPPDTAGEVVAQEGIARLKVALPVLADQESLVAEGGQQDESCDRGG